METGCFETSVVVTPDYCDAAGRLSPQAALTIFQGLAARHAEELGVGGAAMARRGEFWLTVHCRVDLLRPARLMEELTAATWPEPCAADALRCFRGYSLARGGETVALGRTQWAVLGPGGRVVPFGQSGFPADFPYPDRTGLTGEPARFPDDFAPEDLVMTYTVRPTDIDLGRHMNNVAYVRLLLDCFSASKLAEGSIASVEVHYAAPCLEGETLQVFRRQEGDTVRLAVKKAQGRAAALAAVRFRTEPGA